MSRQMLLYFATMCVLLFLEHVLRGFEPFWIRSVVILLAFPVGVLGVRCAWRDIQNARVSRLDEDCDDSGPKRRS
jgi:hypothetical protein